MILRLNEHNVYYCWFCDAHRVARDAQRQKPCCPRCGQEFAADARLKSAGELSQVPQESHRYPNRLAS